MTKEDKIKKQLPMQKLKELIKKERNLAHTEGTDGSFHTLEEFHILRAKKELCEKFLQFIEELD